MRESLRALGVMVATAFRAEPWRAAGVAVLSSVASVLGAFIAYWLRWLTDGVLEGDATRVLVAAVAIALSSVASHLITWRALRMRTRVGERTSLLIDQRIIDLTAGLPGLEHHERPEYQNEIALLRHQREAMAQTISALSNNLSLLVRVAATVGLLVTVHPLLVLLPLFGLPSLWAGNRVAEIGQKAIDDTVERERTTEHLLRLATSPGPGKELRIFGIGSELRDRHADLWRQIDSRRTRAEFRGALLASLGWLVFAVGYVAAIAFVVQRAVAGDVTPGEVLMVLTLAAQINSQVDRLVYTITFLLRTLKIVGRYVWLLDYAAAARAATGTRPAPDRLEKGIEIRDVSFTYPGTEAPVLRDASLLLPAGSTVAIVGENGAGKTTLVKLLSRFYPPSSGRILVDHVDLQEIDVVDWRTRVSAGFQDFATYEFLARETVGVGDLPAIEDAAAVSGALDRAHASDVITTLPQGLETQLGRSFADGVELSGGQWQKLALGRAMMRAAPLLLILDEPTAALDAETEHALFERYAAATRRVAETNGGITILVSHRFSTVRMADLIVVIDAGRVTEFGSHAELMERGGLYAELYEIQARAYR